jgi:hypothetical protein
MLLFITLPENTEVLRTAAELLEAAEEASAAYSNYIASVNGDVIEVCPDDDTICDDIIEDAPIEVEAIRDPDYNVLSAREAVKTYLSIHGEGTIQAIADATGKLRNTIYGACHALTVRNEVVKTLGNGNRFTHPYRLREVAEAAPVEDDVVVEQVEEGEAVQGYEGMTVRAAIRHYFLTNGNRATSYRDVAEATGKKLSSVACVLSGRSEFRNVESGRGGRGDSTGLWSLSADMYRQGWMVVGR